ncbi:ABC transporter ATP-binding protein [Thauera sp. WH-1]|uniref:ABC transporter ATP-binding protein n=1 Tax=Thauera sp. WH-1 TaxID=3398230 RepID=UPI0039FC0750
MLDIRIDRKRYPDRGGRPHLALSGLQLRVQPGEFVCVVGPSGCGKSTLLNIVGGLDRDMEGRVELDGAFPEDVGFMFQEPRLMPWLSVLDNVLLVAREAGDAGPGAGRSKPGTRARAVELLRAMELGDVLDAYPGRLSGGMMRRVALARAFVNEPQLLLMDEPFVSLDTPTANRLREMLVEQWQRCGASVLFVTHDLREALALADRVCFLSAAPARVVLELEVELARPRQPATAEVGRLHERLMAQYPDLLGGLALATGPTGNEDGNGEDRGHD